MDNALENARSAKASIDAQIAALTERARKIQAFIDLYGEFAQGNTPESSGGAFVQILPLPTLAAPPKRKTIPDVAAQILADGYPRTTAVLLNMLASQGVHVGGVNKPVNLSSALSRDTRFKNTKGKGWSLFSTPQPASPSSVGAEEGLFSN